MKIQICSDLHLEFEHNRDWLYQNPLDPKGDILIIAGDTYHLGKDFADLDFIKKVSDEFQSVYLIPGNHEYYRGYDISTALGSTHEKILDNVFLVNNQVVEIEKVKFIFSTMWSKIQNNALAIMNGMNDFRLIKFKDQKFNVNQFNLLHDKAFDFISEAVKDDGKKVVVTHHLPSIDCNIEEFKGSTLNEAFCVDKTNFILEYEIDFWIYGHSHRNMKDFKIGNTQMVTNQFGYVGWSEHLSFDSAKVIEI